MRKCFGSLHMIDFNDIAKARENLGGFVDLTPLEFSYVLSREVGREVYLKFENLQRTGSFKIRGAFNKIANLEKDELRRGVIAASAGNHAQGVAYAAGMMGIRATVVMPEGTPLMKVVSTRRYGAWVVLRGETYDDAYRYALELQRGADLTFIHAFDDPLVIAGQGTIGLELMEQLPDLSTVVVPVGGGGLISGIAIAVKNINPKVRVIGVQAENAKSMKLSLSEGELFEVDSAHTIADGIAVKRAGEVTFPIVKSLVDDIVTVEEEEIASAILMFIEKAKTVVEGAGATTLAALLYDKVRLKSGKFVLILSGGNIDVNMISRVIDKGLVKTGRLARISVMLPDRPGSLNSFTELLAQSGVNILNVSHNRAFSGVPIGEAEVRFSLELRGCDHRDELLRFLRNHGHKVELLD